MVEMEKDQNKHRVRNWYVAKGIDEGEVRFKDHDEERAIEGRTPGNPESRATRPEDVHMSDPSSSGSSSNMALRVTSKRDDNEQGRAETSSDDSNLVRGTVRTRGGEKIRTEITKPKLKCLNLCNVDVQNMESMFIENDPTFVVTSSQQSAETRQAWKTHQHEKTKCFTDAEKREITTNSAAVFSTPMARKIVKNISTEGPCTCRCSGI